VLVPPKANDSRGKPGCSAYFAAEIVDLQTVPPIKRNGAPLGFAVLLLKRDFDEAVLALRKPEIFKADVDELLGF
jgi:hypothetical protein